MPFRFRRSTRLGPLRFNFSKQGLSSISIGSHGASYNIPVGRSGGARTTLAIPGTGMSWSAEQGSGPVRLPAGAAEGLPNSRRLRTGQLEGFKLRLLEILQEQVFAPGSAAQQLWQTGMISKLLVDPAMGARMAELLAVIETPEALQSYLLRAQSQDEAKRRSKRCIEAVQEALRITNDRREGVQQ